jgi:hypothetical protein
MALSEKNFVISFVNPNGRFAKLVKLFIMIRQLAGLLLKEWRSPIKLSFFKTLWVWKHGFYRETYALSS